MIVDFHCHLDLYPEPHSVAQAIEHRRIATLSVTTTPSAYIGTAALAAGKPMIKTALGIHPELAAERSSELEIFDSLLPRAEFVGEVGLDGLSRNSASRPVQRLVFDHILRSCAREGGRVMSVHSRGAPAATLAALASRPDAGIAVLHWFTGTPKNLQTAITYGCWFSVGLPMLATEKGRELVRSMPIDRILTETDGPFTATSAGPAYPWHVTTTLEALAQVVELPETDARQLVSENFANLVAAAK
ncbi:MULTISPECIES: Qat anti-phage system TatD family nuclease QatD [unclassified Aeromicrobium]|uniref:Qat anti-phage system TatD family nuclease QatD n=1 Tax=unclassified Aeromicrobium TaxID=2633570 RepID=UPI00396AFF82